MPYCEMKKGGKDSDRNAAGEGSNSCCSEAYYATTTLSGTVFNGWEGNLNELKAVYVIGIRIFA